MYGFIVKYNIDVIWIYIVYMNNNFYWNIFLYYRIKVGKRKISSCVKCRGFFFGVNVKRGLYWKWGNFNGNLFLSLEGRREGVLDFIDVKLNF